MDTEGIVFGNENNIPNICLLCFESDDGLVAISGKEGIDLKIASILQEHFWFDVGASDEQHICEQCWKKVESFDNFYNFVKCIHQEQCTTIHDTEAFKFEPELVINDVLDDDESNDLADTANSSNETQTKRRRIASPSTSTETHPHPKRDHATLTLAKYFNMSCDLCDTLLRSFTDAKKHYKNVHGIFNGYLICCKKKFYRLPEMLQHCATHATHARVYRLFPCNDCNKTFTQMRALKAHQMRNEHDATSSTNTKRQHLNALQKNTNGAKSSTIVERALKAHQMRNEHDATSSTNTKRQHLNALQKNTNGAKSSTIVERPGNEPRVNFDHFDEENEMIRSQFLMQCDLCGEKYDIFRDAELHHLNAHSPPGYLNCCGRKFFKFCKVVEHCVWHNDPESIKCQFLQKTFTSNISLHDNIEELRNHISSKHRVTSLQCVDLTLECNTVELGEQKEAEVNSCVIIIDDDE